MKLQQLRPGTYCVYLPSKIVQAMTWQKGDNIEITIGGKNKLELSKKLDE